MEMYLLKSAACLAILLLFYKLLLEKENMHLFKRFYLLAAPVISFGIPAISFPEYVTISSEGTAFFSQTSISKEAAKFPLFEWLAGSIYLLGVLFFGSRFFFNLRSLLKKARKNPKLKTSGAIQVLLKDDVIPHTFWSYIYLNRKKFETKQIPQEVLDHELAHVRQKHSADILFMEVLQVLLWFIPLIYLLKKAVKLNHEFLADSAVLQKANNASLYQQILLSFSSGEQNELVNSINYQSIKKRFTVMKKQPSQKAVLLRTFIFLPLLAIMLYSFSGRNSIVQTESSSFKYYQQEQEIVTPEILAWYNKWAKDYNKKGGTQLVEKRTWEKMKSIYAAMSSEQRKMAEDFPSFNPQQIITVVENKDSDKNRAAVRQERQVIREERKVQREEREIERKEHREVQVERRETQRQVPPPPAPPVPPTPQEGKTPLPPPPPPAPQNIDAPMPPPPPPSPEQAIKNWMEEGAEFFYNGEKVSGKEALEAVQKKNGKNLSVQVQDRGAGKTVRISDNKR